MPWQLLFRLASGILLWRLAANRRRGGPNARPFPPLPGMQRVRDLQETASLLSRVAITAGFGVATALCIAAGTSSAVLSPRWLGGVLLAAGAVFAVVTLREARAARAMVTMRRLRRRDRRLRGEV